MSLIRSDSPFCQKLGRRERGPLFFSFLTPSQRHQRSRPQKAAFFFSLSLSPSPFVTSARSQPVTCEYLCPLPPPCPLSITSTFRLPSCSPSVARSKVYPKDRRQDCVRTQPHHVSPCVDSSLSPPFLSPFSSLIRPENSSSRNSGGRARGLTGWCCPPQTPLLLGCQRNLERGNLKTGAFCPFSSSPFFFYSTSEICPTDHAPTFCTLMDEQN